MRSLHIARGFTLPLDTVTQTLAILARKGSGKTFTARKIAEELFKAGLQVVDIDPKGDHWGMRSSADGKGPGLGFLILGGEHGDLELEAGAGEVVAKLVVEERVSVILDLSLFRKHEVATFCTAFLENLYRLKAREAYRTPVMLLVDEADAVAPQKPQRGEERMLGAIEDIVRRGRQRGIGCTLVTQRSAVLNKNVLTQAQVMVAMRTIAPQDLAAMDAWIDVHGTVEQREQLMSSLPSLPRGDAWVWSPGWPTDKGIFAHIHVSPIETFDSGATPGPGERRIVPKKRANVDLDALRRQMASSMDRAKANDPAALRKRVAELEAALAKANVGAERVGPTKRVEVKVPVLKPREVHAVVGAVDKLLKAQDRLAQAQQVVVTEAGTLRSKIEGALRVCLGGIAYTGGQRIIAPPPPTPPPQISPRLAAPARTAQNLAPSDGALGNGAMRRMLTALAQRPQGLTNQQIGVRAGISSKSGTFANYIGRLRAQGWADGRGTVRITAQGLEALGSFTPLPEGKALAAYWVGELGGGMARMLRALVDAYPNSMTNEQLGAAAQIAHTSGTFANYLGRLRSLELVTGRGDLKAAEELAP